MTIIFYSHIFCIFLLLRDWTSVAILWWKHPAVNEGRKAATISWIVIIYFEKDHHFNDGWAIVDTYPEKLTDCHVVICWWWPLSRCFNKSNGNGIFPCYNGPQQIYLAFIVWPMISNDICVTIVKTPFLFQCIFSLTLTFLIQFSFDLKLILIWEFIPPKFELTFSGLKAFLKGCFGTVKMPKFKERKANLKNVRLACSRRFRSSYNLGPSELGPKRSWTFLPRSV